MKQPRHQPDDSWEHDAVWKLLDQAPPPAASRRFVADTLRAARLAGQPSASWWTRQLRPLPLASGLAAAAACIALLLMLPDRQAVPVVAGSSNSQSAEEIQASQFADIQEIADAELLNSAADQLDDFSDLELVSLIGF